MGPHCWQQPQSASGQDGLLCARLTVCHYIPDEGMGSFVKVCFVLCICLTDPIHCVLQPIMAMNNMYCTALNMYIIYTCDDVSSVYFLQLPAWLSAFSCHAVFT